MIAETSDNHEMRFHQLEEAMADLVARKIIFPETGDVSLLRRSHKFYIGDVERLPGNIDITTLNFPKLPFPVVAFEFQFTRNGRIENWIALAEERAAPRDVRMLVWFKHPQAGWVPVGEVLLQRDAPHKFEVKLDAQFISQIDRDAASVYVENATGVFTMIGVALQVLNCVNVKTEIVLAPDKLNKKRAVQRRPPIYEYKVLVLRRGGKGRDLGGTHSSPPLHWRRGHIKHRRTGDYWWQPHVVGDVKRGVVGKEYRADKLVGDLKKPKVPGVESD